MVKMKRPKCVKVFIPPNACYISFVNRELAKNETKFSQHTMDGETFETVRGETFTIDYNKDGLILGIELLDSPKAHKPCQNSRIWKSDEYFKFLASKKKRK